MGIIKELQNDLDNAAVRVVGEYRARLHAAAVKLCGDASEADDLVMRTFDAAFRDTKSYDATKGELYPCARASFQRNAGLFAIAREGCLSGLQRGS